MRIADATGWGKIEIALIDPNRAGFLGQLRAIGTVGFDSCLTSQHASKLMPFTVVDPSLWRPSSKPFLARAFVSVNGRNELDTQT